MTKHMVKNFLGLLALGVVTHNTAIAAPLGEGLVQPKTLVVDGSLSETQRNALILAARRYYTFWHTGDAGFAKAALAENFKDLNLPQGRPQGPEGPLQASKQFREAVPDLKAEVTEMWVVGDKVIGRLHFTGHFTGKFMGTQGTGQAIDFSAVDIYRIEQGKIIENWHLEDNLTLLKQLGAVTMKK